MRHVRNVQLRELTVGCFGGGTGLPSLLGGLKQNPWLRVNAVVTMFDSGGSSGQLRDELGVLPPGDVLKCALALARHEREARRLLLSRLPSFGNGRLGGHTGGNLLLSMMEQYSGDFVSAVDGLRTLLDCNGHVLPVSVEHAMLCASYEDGSQAMTEVGVDREQAEGRRVKRIWLDPEPNIHQAVSEAIRSFDAVVIGPGSFYTSLIPILLARGVADAVRTASGPLLLVTNILTEGRGMHGFTAGEAVQRVSDAIGRPVDVVIANDAEPAADVRERYAVEQKELLPVGEFRTGASSSLVISGRARLRGWRAGDLRMPYGVCWHSGCCSRAGLLLLLVCPRGARARVFSQPLSDARRLFYTTRMTDCPVRCGSASVISACSR